MPWAVKKAKGPRPYKIVRADTGKVVGSSTNRKAAEASVRARYANTPEFKSKPKKGFPG